jgi:hypothetical protein
LNIITVDKPYSWLQWPVSLLNYEDGHPHVTAKFFGKAKISGYFLSKELSIFEDTHFRSTDFVWLPKMFQENFVLELIGYPAILHHVHHKFDLIEDQFFPFKPHITVSEFYWNLVKDNNLTPEKEEFKLGNLEFCKGGGE